MIQKSKILTLMLICAIALNTSLFFNENNILVEESIQYDTHPHKAASDPTIELLSNTDVDNFFAGNGTDGLTPSTAHVIQDLQINAFGSGNVVFLENVDRYVIFRNCTIINGGVTGSDAGVKLISCSNIILENCTISQNGFYGMYLLNCNFIVIEDSNLSLNGGSGIYFQSTNHSMVVNSELSFNDIGVEAGEGSNNIEILGNSIVDNLYYGIYLDRNSYSSISSNHILGANDFGIFLEVSTDDLIYNNTIFGAADRGITIYKSNNTIVGNNNVQSCSYGLEMWGGDFSGNYNIIENNNFSNNTHYGIILDDRCLHTQILDNIVADNNDYGVYLTDRIFNTTIDNNLISNNSAGLYLDRDSNFTQISYNIIRENRDTGLYLTDTANNSVFKNLIEENFYGITLSAAHSQTFYGNIIMDNTYEGVEVGDSEYNLFAGNNITQNDNGLVLQGTSINNTVWMNFISNNTGVNGQDEFGDNFWDNGDVGNYWGDYEARYPLAIATDNIWSIEYEVNASGGETNVNDTLPLVSATSFLEIVPGVDFKYGHGQTGNDIQWYILSSTPILLHYWIYLEDELLQTGSWNTEGVSFNVDGLAVGTYDFKIVVSDGTAWQETEDVVQVEVGLLPGKPIFITGNQDVTSPNVTINWGTTLYADSYDIYIDDVFLANTDETWMIVVLTENRTYSIHIIARNEYGESTPSDPLLITVDLTEDPTNVIYYVLGGAFVLIGAGAGVFIFIKKKKTT